ncbi:hypothetical protein [Hymenobacter jejuensis]|uniref:Tetratricopeptide repeat protein n=1 Tax=Hymenobacter jejuensis TaxID=2502781 RepID=A0A5B8A069_9BACT|nr:hypothetical protein [Hymenobacter jejuensis]QDA60874.1 hypothetical protein FHG12_12505 [Hymenobacter jejuensis]
MLKLEGEYTLSERMMRKCLRIAQEAEFTQYAVMSAQALRTLYAELRQPARYKTISAELMRLQTLLTLEETAAQVYWDTKIALAHSVKSRRFLLNELPAHIKELEKLHQQAGSFTTFNYLYNSLLFQQGLVGDYDGIIRLTATTAKDFAKGKINAKRFDKRFNNFMSVYAHLRCRRVQEGLVLAEHYLQDFHHSSGNWFYFLEHYLLLAMHAANYAQARDLINMARKNPYYRKQRVAAQQRWDLYDAYLQFVLPDQSPLRAMHFAQFVQTVPDYSRDKQGYNVAILILQFLHYLRRRDIETLMARLESLRKYQQTHLRDPATLRSQLFFRLLVLTVKKDFDSKASEKHGQAWLARLREAPQPGEAFAEIEIIPYEDLWALTLNILRTAEVKH